MNLIVDFGNTRTKSALFNDGQVKDVVIHEDIEKWKDWVGTVSFDKAIVSNVGQSKEVLKTIPDAVVLTQELNFLFDIAYKTPKTLGVDRLALSAGAKSIHQEGAVLVVDLGTCITYDLVDENNVYQGGAISPGIRIRAKAMHTFTESLPLVDGVQDVDLIGKSTVEGMESGIFNGVVAELNGIIERYKQRYPEIQIYLSGGDAELFESKINHSIFVQPNLALLGLNEILELNT